MKIEAGDVVECFLPGPKERGCVRLCLVKDIKGEVIVVWNNEAECSVTVRILEGYVIKHFKEVDNES